MPLTKVTDEGQALTEYNVVAAGIVTLLHLPDPKSPVTIPGFTQTNTPIPKKGEFFVNYASGVISFNAGSNGAVTNTSYSSLGEDVDAAYINQLVDAILTPITESFPIVKAGNGASQVTINTTHAPKAILSAYAVNDTTGVVTAPIAIVTPTDFAAFIAASTWGVEQVGVTAVLHVGITGNNGENLRIIVSYLY